MSVNFDVYFTVRIVTNTTKATIIGSFILQEIFTNGVEIRKDLTIYIRVCCLFKERTNLITLFICSCIEPGMRGERFS